jgi:gliding motility-associated-like protein
MHPLLRALLIFCVLGAGSAGMSYAQTANFTASTTSGCAPLIVQFNSTSTGTVTSYAWNLGNGAIVPTSNSSPSTTYTTPGSYTVTLTINGAGGSSITKTNFITVHPAPIISFSHNNSTGCAPHTVTFTSSVTPGVSGPVTYNWYYGNGFLGTGSSSTHSYAAAGTYSVTLTATNSAGCSNSLQQLNLITVLPKPGGTFTATPTYSCKAPATISFANSAATGASPFTVYWDFGDGGTSTSHNPSHTYNTPGLYTVRLVTADANGCKDTITRSGYIDIHSSNASISGPTDICQPFGYMWTDSVLFANTTPSHSTTTWDFGDSTTGFGSTIRHAFRGWRSTYTVRMVTLVGSCYDTVYHVVNLHVGPQYRAAYAPNPNCTLPVTMTFATIPAATSYHWSWWSGGTSTAAQPTKTYLNSMIDSVYVIGTDANGCKDTAPPTPVYVYDPIAYITGPLNGCAPLTATYKSNIAAAVHPYPDSAVSWYWDFGDGSTSTADTPNHTYNAAGDYTLTVRLVTTLGCVFTDTVVVHVGTKIYPSFSATPNPVCAGQEVYFTNLTGYSPSSTLSYTWDLGDGAYTPVNNTDAVHIYVIPGIYTITLISTNNGCSDTATKVNWMIVNGPNANFIDTVLCINQHRTVAFTNQSIQSTSQLWFFGDGGTDTAFSPVHTYALTGTYSVTLTTYNNITGCRDTLVLPVTVGTPVMNFTAADTTICKGDTLKITHTYTGPPSTIKFLVHGGTEVNGPNRNTTYFIMNDTGFHRVLMISTLYSGSSAISTFCFDTVAKQNYIFVSKPIAGFKATPTLGCTPLVVIFTDTSHYNTGTTAATRNWAFGNTNTGTSTTSTISETYTKAGLYTVQFVATDANGCKDYLTKTDYIDARHPVAGFVANYTAACVWQVISFTDNSTGSSNLKWRWHFGDGDSSTAQNPNHAYAQAGSYTVRLIVTDTMGCSDTLIRSSSITISQPTAAFTLSDSLSVCPPLTVSFTSTSVNASTLLWDFDNGSNAGFANPSTLYSKPGVYNVKLIVSDLAGCMDTAIAQVRVLGYAGALTYSPLTGCVPLTVNFTTTMNNMIPKIVWDFSDGDTALVTNGTYSHTYINAGAFVPKLIFYDTKGCSASSLGIDTIKVDDVMAGFKATTPCVNTPMTLVDTSVSLFSALKSWQWSFGPGQIATGRTVPRIYAAAGKYPVTLIVSNANGCTDTLVSTVTIHPLPIIKAAADTVVCPPDGVQLSATGGRTYAWSPGSSLSCTNCDVPTASPTVPTAYIVIGTDSNTCSGKDTLRVGIQTITSFSVSSGGEICLGEGFQLIASGATTYSWTPASSLNDAQSGSPIARPTTTTTYIATGREGSCLADTHIVKVVVNPLPVIDAGKDEVIIAGNNVQLQVSGSGVDHLVWALDSTLSCTNCYGPFAAPKSTTTYYVTAYSNKGCEATDSVTVKVLCHSSQLYIPNTFTPNGDGLNDFFFPRGKGVEIVKSFRVYSRWGELLFERNGMPVNDEYAGWNGTHKGQKLAPDVYVYIIEADCDNGSPIQWKGDVTIVR